MKQQCAWCGKTLSEKFGKGEGVSHGICDTCMQVVINDDGTSLQSLIEQLVAPVLVVDDNVEVITGNSAAQQLLGRSVISIKGYRGGDAIGCAQAARPGGCGRQGVCKACVIRRSVNHTWTTGEPVQGALAEQTILKDGVSVVMRFHITTMIRGRAVLLMIGDVRPGGAEST